MSLRKFVLFVALQLILINVSFESEVRSKIKHKLVSTTTSKDSINKEQPSDSGDLLLVTDDYVFTAVSSTKVTTTEKYHKCGINCNCRHKDNCDCSRCKYNRNKYKNI